MRIEHQIVPYASSSEPLTSILPLAEITRNSSVLVRMDGNQTILTRTPTDDKAVKEEDKKAFTFDKSFWSVDPDDPHYAGQEAVYNDLGEDLMGHAFDGYNCCIFACK
jgi:kinesin family protein 1